MSRRGFVLIAVLWAISVGGLVVALSAGDARVEESASRNRVLVARARWAAEACAAIARGRFASGGFSEDGLEALGRTTTCTWHLEDLAARLNVGRAERAMLERFLAANGVVANAAVSIADTILALKRDSSLTDTEVLRGLKSFPERLLPFLTTDGPGLVNPGIAPPEVLVALPGLTPEAVALAHRWSGGGRPLSSLSELMAGLSPGSRAVLAANYADLARLTAFGRDELVLHCKGWVAEYGDAPRVSVDLGVRPVDGSLLVLWRRVR